MAGKGALLAAEISKEGAAGKSPSPAHSNLFVGNIPATLTEDDLNAAFAPFGAIESALLVSKAGRPSGFVKMVEVSAAQSAMVALDGKDGWVVKFANYDIGKAPKWSMKGKGFGDFVGFGGFGGGYGGWDMGKGFGKGWNMGKGFGGKGGGWSFVKGGYGMGKGGVPELREDGPERPEPPQSDNLYVKHLPIGVTEDNLKDTFSACGSVEEVRILRPDFALECAALVRFASVGEADTARNSLDGTVVQGSTPPLYANAQNKSGTSKKDHVYVKNVPTNCSEDKLKEMMAKFGTVKWHKIMRSSPGQSRIGATCAALFEMSSEEEAEAAIQALNNTPLSLSVVAPPMKVRFAENKAANKTVAEAEAAARSDEAGDAAPQMPLPAFAGAPPPPPP